MYLTSALALPHRAGQAARHDEDAQLEEGDDQTAPSNQVRIGGPEVDELLPAARSLAVDLRFAHLGAILVAAAGAGHGFILLVSRVATARELQWNRYVNIRKKLMTSEGEFR